MALRCARGRPGTWMLLALALVCAPTGGQPRVPIAAEDVPPRDDHVWQYDSWAGPPYVEPQPLPSPIVPKEWWVVPASAGGDGWSWFQPWLLDPSRPAPSIPPAEGAPTSAWELRETAQPSNVVCAWTRIHSDHDEVRMARLSGAAFLFVGGEGFVGDPDRRGFGGVPVPLREGDNDVFVFGIDGSFELELWMPRQRTVIGTWDVAWPVLAQWGEPISFPVFNASSSTLEDLTVTIGRPVPIAEGKIGPLTSLARAGPIHPLACRRATIELFDFEGPHRLDDVVVAVCAYASDAADRQRLVSPDRSPVRAHPAEPGGSVLERFERARILIYGTHGGAADRAATYARARFDQQWIWYRTGSIPELWSDEEMAQALEGGWGSWRGHVPWKDSGGALRLPSFSMSILYGNAVTNSVWKELVSPVSPVRVEPNVLRIDGVETTGDDIGGWFVPKDDWAGPGPFLMCASTGRIGTLLGYRWITQAAGALDREFHQPSRAEPDSLTTVGSRTR